MIEWQLCVKYMRKLQADHCLFLNFDFYQSFPVFGARFPGKFSGIYHNLWLHFPEFETNLMTKERMRSRIQQWTVKRVTKCPSLDTLFCLDPLAADYISTLSPTIPVVHLPTPGRSNEIDTIPERIHLKNALQIEPNRRIFLLFGSIDHRKGIQQILQSLYLLPQDAGKKVCLLLIGRHQNKAKIQKEANRISETTSVQVISIDEFIPEEQIALYFDLADVALAIHQRHVGVSVTLVHAAIANRPVLASDFGLLGELVRRNGLGVTVDSESPKAIADGICAYLENEPTMLCDHTSMGKFAQQNTIENYAPIIVEQLLS